MNTICLILRILYKILYKFWYNFNTVLYQFLETGTSDRWLSGIRSTPRILSFQPIPLLFFLYSHLKDSTLMGLNQLLRFSGFILLSFSFHFFFTVPLNLKVITVDIEIKRLRLTLFTQTFLTDYTDLIHEIKIFLLKWFFSSDNTT